MKRARQNGCIVRHHGWWVLRYRELVGVGGEIKTRCRAKRLAPVDAEHKTKASVRYLAELELEPLNRNRLSPLNVTTLGDFVERIYLPYVMRQKSPSTYRGYRQIWHRYLRSRCKGEWMREAKTYRVQKWLDEIANQRQIRSGREYSLSRTTIAHIKNFLSGVFRHAAQQGYFDQANPVRLAEIPAFAPKGHEGQAYTLEEVREMLRVLPEPAATVVMVAAYTGLRLGELQGLTWEDYTAPDEGEELGLIEVNRSIWRGRIGEPKTERSKAPVPVIPQLVNRLTEFRKSIGGACSGPIFANSLGRPSDLNSLYYRRMRKVLTTSGMRWIGWHGFRRGLASNLNRLGIDDSVIQAILRHSDVSVTQRCYIKTLKKDAAAAMRDFSTAISRLDADPNGSRPAVQ